jgi:hypothetical protein
MRRVLTFESTCFDARRVGPLAAGQSLTFMTGALPDDEQEGPSVTDVAEAAVLRWSLTKHATARSLICHHLGLPESAKHCFSVTSPVLPRGCTRPGDIDWLSADVTRPELAVVAECKRVKVAARSDGSDHVNKIESLGRGVRQANALVSYGLHRTFLIIIIVVDGRSRTENNVVFRGMNEETFQRVYEFPDRDALNDDVGVAYIEVVQPSKRHVDSMAQIGICVDRQAKPREQAASMTNRVREVLSRPE